MQRIAILGSTELSQRLIHAFETTGFARVVGLLDDFVAAGEERHGRPLLGPLAEAPALARRGAFDAVAIGIGYRHRDARRRAFAFLREASVAVATFVHPGACIDPTARFAEGCIVMLGACVDMHAALAENVFLSARCYVSHHVTIGAHSYVAPAVTLGGHTAIGECAFLGIGTTTADGVCIGSNTQTAAGAVVVGELPGDVLAAGVPARVKRQLSPRSPAGPTTANAGGDAPAPPGSDG